MEDQHGRVTVRAVRTEEGYRVVVLFDGSAELISREIFATLEEANAAVVDTVNTIGHVLEKRE